MRAWRRPLPAALLMTACLLILGGCRAVDRMPAPDRVGGFDGLSKLYRESAAPHRRAFRRPIRDARREAMRLLAEKAGRMADQSSMPSVAPVETDADPTISAKENDAVAAYRDSLRSLEAAARRGSIPAVRTAYARAEHRYRLLKDVPAAAIADH